MQFDNLRKSGLLDAMSDTARDLFLPQGIFHWSGRAKKEAEIDATIGSAQGKKSSFLPGADDSVCTFYLPTVMKKFAALGSEQVVPYAPINGLPRYRNAWRKWIVEKLSPHYKFDANLIGTPTVVPGVTSGLAYLGRLFLSDGETILCHDCKWENYTLVFSGTQKLVVKSVPLFKGAGLDIDSLASAIREIMKKQNPVVVLNFPNNPTGYMPGIEESKTLRAELLKLADEAAAAGRKIAIIFDDAYDGFVYDPAAAPISIFGHFVGAHPAIIPVKCDGASKEFLLYGSRAGCVTFAFHPDWGDQEAIQKELDNKLGAFIRGTVSNCNLASQQAVAAAIEENGADCSAERERITGILAARWRALKKALDTADLGGNKPDPYNSGFFCFLNLDIPADKLADHLLVKYKLGVIPLIEPEVNVNGIRIAFCSVEETLIQETVDRIAAGIKDIKK